MLRFSPKMDHMGFMHWTSWARHLCVCMQKMFDSNLGQDAGCRNGVSFLSYSSVLSSKCLDSALVRTWLLQSWPVPSHTCVIIMPNTHSLNMESIVNQHMKKRDLWWTRWHWGGFLSEHLILPLPLIIFPMLHNTNWAGKIGPFEAGVPRVWLYS